MVKMYDEKVLKEKDLEEIEKFLKELADKLEWRCLGCGEKYTDDDASHYQYRCIICGFDMEVFENEGYSMP